MALFFSFCLPSRKAGGLQIPCCQGIAVADYSFTLDALALKPSSFCNVGATYRIPDKSLTLTISIAVVFKDVRKRLFSEPLSFPAHLM
jgi:hypothetical protein